MAELLPCPFCGSTRIGVHMYRQRRSSGYKALCLECGISQSGVCRPSIEAAQAAWNTRAAPPPAGAQQAAFWIDGRNIEDVKETTMLYNVKIYATHNGDPHQVPVYLAAPAAANSGGKE